MAEYLIGNSFQKVMREMKRMVTECCNENDSNCDRCPLDSCGICSRVWCEQTPEDFEEYERIVMRWTNEHPEPKYPTWGQWLESIGQAEATWGDRIPADIARKHNIKPVEG